MTSTAADLDTAADTAAGVLAFARDRRAAADAAEADLLRAACAWADLHPAESIHDAVLLGRHGDQPLPVAGPGAPLVAEFCVAEFAAAVGLPTETGKAYLGEALELRHRLPKTWARVGSGDLPAWRARRIARADHRLSSPAAAGFVDDQVAPFAHRIRPSGVDRLVEEAIVRFMPEPRRGAAGRPPTTAGTPTCTPARCPSRAPCGSQAEVDLADALDLDTALSAGAARLADLGSAASLDVRRSEALGEMARHQLPSTSTPDPAETADRREVVLHVHLSEDAITTPDASCTWPGWRTPARFVDADQVRDLVRPPRHQRDGEAGGRPDRAPPCRASTRSPTGSPPRPAERDLTCVFPWCTRPAEACDLDHVIPYSEGGTTGSDNLAPLCRRHHRLKTHHSGWGYTVLEPGSYLWSSPHGYQFLRDHRGTTDVTHARPPDE